MEGEIGSVGKYSLSQGAGADAGKLCVEVDVTKGNSSAGLIVKLSEKDVLDYFIKKYGSTSILGEVAGVAEKALG